MRLEVASFPVRQVVLGEESVYQDGVLHVDRAGLEARLAQQTAVKRGRSRVQ